MPEMVLLKDTMTWPCDGRTFARKVKDPTYGVHGNKGQAKSLECPACGYHFDQNNEWPGLPAGVKFDPSDQELLEHLITKVDGDASKAHPFINEFIPTLNEEDGICYTHPEKIPGVRHNGSSAHFFHRPAKAYTTGTRKRRKIQTGEETVSGLEMRWHKTGKTRPVVENGKQIGCKKIMVLYVSSGKKAKADKSNWVMHQYHLGLQEEEKEGEYVVSKIFYQMQPRQCGIGRKEDGDDPENVIMEMAEQQVYSSHHSSPSTFSNSNNTLGATPPPPSTPGPFQGYAVKQHKGLLATITEDVERLQASLSGHSHNTVQSSDQESHLAMGYDCTSSCKSASKIQVDVGSANYSVRCSPELGEKDTCCSKENKPLGKESQLEAYHGAATHVVRASIVCSSSDSLSIIRKPDADTHETAVPKSGSIVSDDNADTTLRLQGTSEVANAKADDKAEFVLENIILDTPPDFLLESFLNSQESTDWFGRKKFWSDSSQKTDDGNCLDFLRDSQSSV